jgi:acetoin utilization deacetylase AcuC-like enzyme
MAGTMKLPILVIQEGGYKNRHLGINARWFLKGLYEEHFKQLAISNEQ